MCRHGGPENTATILEFCQAASTCSLKCLEATQKVFETIKAGDFEEDLIHLATAELDTLFAFWSQEKEMKLIDKDSYRICFSCACDALWQSESANARFFVRLGEFVRLVSLHGVAQLREDMRSDTAGAKERIAPLIRVMDMTTNDRGVAVFLNKEVPCGCLDKLSADGVCVNCLKDVDPKKGPIKRCARCKIASYCSKECQMADWKRHRVECTELPRVDMRGTPKAKAAARMSPETARSSSERPAATA